MCVCIWVKPVCKDLQLDAFYVACVDTCGKLPMLFGGGVKAMEPFNLIPESMDVLANERALSYEQRTVLKEIVQKYGCNRIERTLADLGAEFMHSERFMQEAMKKWIECFYVYSPKRGVYYIAEFFWYRPEPGLNAQGAMNRYVKKVTRRLKENGRRHQRLDPNWKHTEGFDCVDREYEYQLRSAEENG